MSRNRAFFAAAAAAAMLSAEASFAADLCQGGPRDQWLSEAEIAERMSALGHIDYVLSVEDGCIEVILSDGGSHVEIYMEPVTGEIVKTEYE